VSQGEKGGVGVLGHEMQACGKRQERHATQPARPAGGEEFIRKNSQLRRSQTISDAGRSSVVNRGSGVLTGVIRGGLQRWE
jgi:hypothetical protein